MLAFSALAEPNRLKIVEMIARKGAMAVSDISSKFAISTQAISQHLKVLRDAQLLKVEVKAQQRIYSINPAGMSEIESWLGNMRQFWEDRFDALDNLLAAELKKSEKNKKKVK